MWCLGNSLLPDWFISTQSSLFSLTPGACVCPLFEMAVPMILLLSFVSWFLEHACSIRLSSRPWSPAPPADVLWLRSLILGYELHRNRWSGWQMLLRVSFNPFPSGWGNSWGGWVGRWKIKRTSKRHGWSSQSCFNYEGSDSHSTC